MKYRTRLSTYLFGKGMGCVTDYDRDTIKVKHKDANEINYKQKKCKKLAFHSKG